VSGYCLSLRILGLLLTLGFVACDRHVEDMAASVDGDEESNLVNDEKSSAKRRRAKITAKPSTSPNKDLLECLVLDQDRARDALSLVDAGEWEQAAAQLEKLSDLDFVVPQRYEIIGVRDDGVRVVEPIREHSVGNRQAALVRCYYHLGRLRDTRPHVWQVIEEDSFEPTCLRSIIELNRDDLDTVTQRVELISENASHNTAAKKLIEYIKLVRLLDRKRFEQAIKTITYGCSCRDDNVPLTPKEAYDQLAAETIADQGAAIVPQLVASLQPSPDEVHSCIVYALELCGDERGVQALITAREGVRNDGLRKRLDRAIDRIRQRLAESSD